MKSPHKHFSDFICDVKSRDFFFFQSFTSDNNKFNIFFNLSYPWLPPTTSKTFHYPPHLTPSLCKPQYVTVFCRYPVSLAHRGGCCCWAVCLGIWARKLYSIDHARYQHTIIWVNHVELWQIHLGLRN